MMQRPYEALVIVKATGTDAEVAQLVTQAEDVIKKASAAIDASRPLGRRRLAYRIGRQNEGFYQLIEFRIDPLQVDELKRLLRLNESIVRFLILTREERAAASVSDTQSKTVSDTGRMSPAATPA